jgi:hypothetical protein
VNLPLRTALDIWQASFSRTPKPPGNLRLVYSSRHLSSAALSSLAAKIFCKSYIWKPKHWYSPQHRDLGI